MSYRYETDQKNGFFGEAGEEVNVKCFYVGYHREGYHTIRLKWYPDAVDNDLELKNVHESLLSKILPENMVANDEHESLLRSARKQTNLISEVMQDVWEPVNLVAIQ